MQDTDSKPSALAIYTANERKLLASGTKHSQTPFHYPSLQASAEYHLSGSKASFANVAVTGKAFGSNADLNQFSYSLDEPSMDSQNGI
jgi:hypothetical protein